MSTTGNFSIKGGSAGTDHKPYYPIQASSSVKQPAPQVMKVPPPVSTKPAKNVHSVVSRASIVDGAVDDLPPPPDEMLFETPSKPAPSIEDELDALTDILAMSLQNSNDPTFFGICCKCRNKITSEANCCMAMGEKHHISCLTCYSCAAQLMGTEFFCLNNNTYCESCYSNTLDDCTECGHKITDRILKAIGKSFHPHCFMCVSCNKNLDGVPFTLDAAGTVHCNECYQLRFSPRCAVCENLIMPTTESGETVHIVSMHKNFHVECYRCEDCGASLSSEGGHGCYPLGKHLLCQDCNTARVKKSTKASSRMSTTL